MQIDPKFAWTVVSSLAGYLVAVTLIIGKLMWDVKRLEKEQNRDRAQAEKEKSAIMAMVESFESTCKEIKTEINNGLYDANKRTRYMPREGCQEKHDRAQSDFERRMESCKAFHHQEVSGVAKEVSNLCKKFDEWQSQVGNILSSVSKFMDRVDGMAPHLLKGGGTNFNNATPEKIDYGHLAKLVAKEMKNDPS
jgi:uncharacterized protein Yka (UPF0111/DUF47 family)